MALVCFFGVVRAWTGYLMDTEILPLLMIIAGIVGAPVGMLALDLWVDSLPSQVPSGREIVPLGFRGIPWRGDTGQCSHAHFGRAIFVRSLNTVNGRVWRA